jgi:type III secretory pathway lipoprotein EscJ
MMIPISLNEIDALLEAAGHVSGRDANTMLTLLMHSMIEAAHRHGVDDQILISNFAEAMFDHGCEFETVH